MPGLPPTVLALAPRATAWVERLRVEASGETSGAVPRRSVAVRVVRCTSAEEVRARLTTSRRFAALLVDDGTPALDRDLLDAARRSGCVPIVVRQGPARIDWRGLGALAELVDPFGVGDLMTVLGAAGATAPAPVSDDGGPVEDGQLVAVCGPGGTGVSTIAAALAQGLAAASAQGLAASGCPVALVDLARHGEQAMLHDTSATSVGVEALVEAHRTGVVATEDLHGFAVPTSRGYDLVVGLRRARAWSVLRPRAVEAALTTLLRGYPVVVGDIDADLEGEAEGGSRDVEERNALARATVARAAAVVVVAAPGLKGTHSMVRVLADLWAQGCEPARTLVVVNRAEPGAGPMVAEALRGLLPSVADAERPGVVVVGEAAVEKAFVTGSPLPELVVDEVTTQTAALLGAGTAPRPEPQPVRVTPGSLGVWRGDEED